MRQFALISVALCAALGLGAQRAQAHEFEVEVATSYLDTDTFNDRFSDDPVAQFTLTLDLGQSFYAEPYVYSGFKDPLADESSEYGIEVGGEWELVEGITFNLAAGRWSNYQGQGFDAGDWFGRSELSYRGVTVSVTGFSGDTDTVVLRTEYKLPISEKLTVTPSIAFITNGSSANPSVSASYQLTERFSLNGKLVAPKSGSEREVYGSLGLVFAFGN